MRDGSSQRDERDSVARGDGAGGAIAGTRVSFEVGAYLPPAGSAAGAAPAVRAPRHVPALDGIRGLAIALVMLFHFNKLEGHTRVDVVVDRLVGGLWCGVDLFFVLSGFLITGILLDAKGGPGYFRNFYARRALRIFPLYYATLALLFLVLPELLPALFAGVAPGTQWWYWGYLSNVLATTGGFGAGAPNTAHFWSLAVEEQFYLVWPFVVFALGRRRLAQLCLACIVIAFALRLGVRWSGSTWIAAYTLMPARMDTLATGALLAVVMRGPDGRARLRAVATPMIALAAVSYVGVVVLQHGAYEWDSPMQTVGYLALAIGWGGVLARVVSAPEANWLVRLFTLRPLLVLGRLSYALYVFHFVVVGTIIRAGFTVRGLPTLFGSQLPGQLLFTLVCAALTLGLAQLSWHLLEQPFLRLKERFSTGRVETVRSALP